MKKKGFTLIELLVVVAIMGLLLSIILVSLKSSRDKAKIAAALQFSSSVHHTLGAYAVGVWDFNENAYDTCEGGEDICDSSGYGNHGDITGAVFVNDTPSGKGYALDFDGNGDYVDVGNDTSLNPTNAITIGVWIKPTDLSEGDWYYIVGHGAEWLNGPLLLYNGWWDEWRWYVSNSTEKTSITYSDQSVGAWIHLVATYDGRNMKLYYNGVEKASTPKTGAIVHQNSNWWMSRSADRSFNGIIDEVRIYEQALTSAQIKKLYAEGAEKYGLSIED